MAFLPNGDVLLAYSVACLILFITPGPDMSFFLAKTVSGGRSAGIAAMLGAQAGCCIHTMLAALGLSALLAASATAFFALKLVGGAYLLWLAVDAIRHGSALNIRSERRADGPLWRIFLLGMAVNLTNPKIVLFFVTFLPQFVSPADPDAAQKLVFLGLLFRAVHTSALRASRVRSQPGDRASKDAAACHARHRLLLRGRVRCVCGQDPHHARAMSCN